SDEIPFTVEDPTPATGAVADVLASGSGWVNLAPDVELEVEPRRHLFAAIFSSRGPELPLATISLAGTDDGSLAIGLQHAGGTRALEVLARAGHELPTRWRKVSDHPRRGLVVSAPTESDPVQLIRWLVDAAVVLTRMDLDEGWVARVYRN